MYDAIDEREIGFVAVDLVKHCNLNCARCCHFSALVQKEWYADLEYFGR